MNQLIENGNAAQHRVDADNCEDPEIAQRELVPLLSQAFSATQKLAATQCNPRVKWGTTAPEIQSRLSRAQSYASDCRARLARQHEALANERTGMEQRILGQQSSPAKSGSCSDITGTNSAVPALSNCKDAGTALRAARVTRQKYPLYAQDQYKKAAESYRLAGDTSQADNVVREAALTDEAFKAEQAAAAVNPSDLVRQDRLRSANNLLNAAKDIVKKPSTCSDLKDAAALYLAAAKAFLDADQVRETDEILLRHDALVDEVDRLEREGRCRRVQERQTKDDEQRKDDKNMTDKCKPVVEVVRQARNAGQDVHAFADSFTKLGCDVDEIDREMSKQCHKLWLNGKMEDGKEFGCRFEMDRAPGQR